MYFSELLSYLSIGLISIASISIPLYFVKLVAQYAGTSLIGGVYTPGHLIELSGMLLIFVVAVLLKQFRDELRMCSAIDRSI